MNEKQNIHSDAASNLTYWLVDSAHLADHTQGTATEIDCNYEYYIFYPGAEITKDVIIKIKNEGTETASFSAPISISSENGVFSILDPPSSNTIPPGGEVHFVTRYTAPDTYQNSSALVDYIFDNGDNCQIALQVGGVIEPCNDLCLFIANNGLESAIMQCTNATVSEFLECVTPCDLHNKISPTADKEIIALGFGKELKDNGCVDIPRFYFDLDVPVDSLLDWGCSPCEIWDAIGTNDIADELLDAGVGREFLNGGCLGCINFPVVFDVPIDSVLDWGCHPCEIYNELGPHELTYDFAKIFNDSGCVDVSVLYFDFDISVDSLLSWGYEPCDLHNQISPTADKELISLGYGKELKDNNCVDIPRFYFDLDVPVDSLLAWGCSPCEIYDAIETHQVGDDLLDAGVGQEFYNGDCLSCQDFLNVWEVPADTLLDWGCHPCEDLYDKVGPDEKLFDIAQVLKDSGCVDIEVLYDDFEITVDSLLEWGCHPCDIYDLTEDEEELYNLGVSGCVLLECLPGEPYDAYLLLKPLGFDIDSLVACEGTACAVYEKYNINNNTLTGSIFRSSISEPDDDAILHELLQAGYACELVCGGCMTEQEIMDLETQIDPFTLCDADLEATVSSSGEVYSSWDTIVFTSLYVNLQNPADTPKMEEEITGTFFHVSSIAEFNDEVISLPSEGDFISQSFSIKKSLPVNFESGDTCIITHTLVATGPGIIKYKISTATCTYESDYNNNITETDVLV
jgi:hypothetical protein